jgi:hypothetical protein
MVKISIETCFATNKKTLRFQVEAQTNLSEETINPLLIFFPSFSEDLIMNFSFSEIIRTD